jgi:transcriptional regulator with XRE-family HTH domain
MVTPAGENKPGQKLPRVDAAFETLAPLGFYERLGLRIFQLKEERGLLQADLAHDLGISESWVSQVIRGRDKASPDLIKRIAEYFNAPDLVEMLGDARTPGLRATTRAHAPALRLIRSYAELKNEMMSIVQTATKFLVCTGSRSAESDYLDAIVERLEEQPDLVHYRVLHGDIFYEILKRHLIRLVALKHSTEENERRIFVSRFLDPKTASEQFITANESRAIVVLPSLNGVGSFDSAVGFSEPEAMDLVAFGKGLNGRSSWLESDGEIRKLPVLYGERDEPTGTPAS